MHGESPIERAIRAAGSPAALAHAVGVTVAAVSYWKKGGHIRADRVLAICEAAGWAVTPHELSPDLYRYETDGLPPEVRKAA
jgi:DNA-binding transcriptional regulator YdaS (Cro superfamily)